MINTEQQIERFLEPFDIEISSLAQKLRKHIKKETAPTIELVGDSTISLNNGYGFTDKAWDCYCAIIVYSRHINISFPSGASLSDPKELLQGSGKRIRHIKIRKFEDINHPDVQNLLLEARHNALELIDANTKQEIRTIVKPISGIKKRPK